MNRIVMACLAAGLVFGINGGAGEKGHAASRRRASTSLFDGQKLIGWKTPDPTWKIVDGTVHYTGAKGASTSSPTRAMATSSSCSTGRSGRPGTAASTCGASPRSRSGLDNLPPNLGTRKEDEGKGSGGMWNNPAGSPGKYSP